MYQDASQFKIANTLIQDNTSEERDDRVEEPISENWREKILLIANPKSVQEEIITNAEVVVKTSSNDKMENNPPELPAAARRPRCDWRSPDYLKDYVIYTILSLCLLDIYIYMPETFSVHVRILDI